MSLPEATGKRDHFHEKRTDSSDRLCSARFLYTDTVKTTLAEMFSDAKEMLDIKQCVSYREIIFSWHARLLFLQ